MYSNPLSHNYQFPGPHFKKDTGLSVGSQERALSDHRRINWRGQIMKEIEGGIWGGTQEVVMINRETS